MSLSLPDLPYASDALEPHMTAKTFSFHHGKHHKAYVEKAMNCLPMQISRPITSKIWSKPVRKSVVRSSIMWGSITITAFFGTACALTVAAHRMAP
jgi:superoxide dismutase